jgi:hypothetical protein
METIMLSVKVITPFKRRGKLIVSGTILNDVPEDVFPELSDLVELLPRYRQDTPTDWSSLPRAWIQNWELRTIGVFEDLDSELAKITSDDHELQRRLLIENCQAYGQAHFWLLIEKWEERAAIMEHDGGRSKEQAEEEAARQCNMLAFLSELRRDRLH